MWKKTVRVFQDTWTTVGIFAGVAIMAGDAAWQLYNNGFATANNATWIGLVLFILFGVAAVIKYARRAADAERRYEEAKAPNTPATTQTKTQNVDRESIGMQDVKNSPINSPVNSYNTNWSPPSGYERPARQDLLHRIAIDIQKFRVEFRKIRYASAENKWDKYLEANKIFLTIDTEPLFHAKILLKDTQIPAIIYGLELAMTKYSLQISDLAQGESDRVYYGKGGPVPGNVLDRMNRTREALDQLDSEIDSMVNQIVDIAAKGNETWLVS